MTVELFKTMLEAIGGIQHLVEAREEMSAFVCAMDDVIELEAKISLGVEVKEEEINEKLGLMITMMKELLE